MAKSQSSLTGIPIERLKGRENYCTWKIAVNAFLDLDDLWTNVVEITNVAELDDEKDRKARNKLKLCIDPVCYSHIQDAKSAAEIWKNLADAYEDSGLARRVGLLRRLITTSLANSKSMDMYVNEIITTAHQLNGVGLKVPDEWTGVLLLAGLPEAYRPMIMALENSGMKITGDSVKTKLLQENVPYSENTALMSTDKTNRCKKPMACWNCGKLGHIARNCRNKQQGNLKKQVQKSGDALCTVLSTMQKRDDNSWFFDSAATTHMCNNSELFTSKENSTGSVIAADGNVMKIIGQGNVTLEPEGRCDGSTVALTNVQYIPEITANLMSISQIVKKNHKVLFDNAGVKVINGDVIVKGRVIVTGKHTNDLFMLNEATAKHKGFAVGKNASFDLWHKRMGHLNSRSLLKLQRDLSVGIEFKDKRQSDCKVCSIGKQTRESFNKPGSRANELLDLVHSDICGPMEDSSLGGARYFLSFIDDKSRKIFVYFLKSKAASEIINKFTEFLNEAERQTERKLKILRSDNGNEYTNNQFQELLKQKGIIHQTSSVYTPEQNGLAERNNRSIVEKARCMLIDAQLEKKFWAEAVNYAVYLLNRSPSAGIDMTPEQAWTGKLPDLSHVKLFGTVAMVHVPDQRRKKWDDKSHECILVGYDNKTKGYRLYDVDKDIVIKSCNVVFIDEGKVTKREEQLLDHSVVYIQSNPEESEVVNLKENLYVDEADQVPIVDATQQLKRSDRNRRLPTALKDYELDQHSQLAAITAPPSYLNKPVVNMQQESKHNVEGCPLVGKYPEYLFKEGNTCRNFSQPFLQDPDTPEEALSRADADQWALAMEAEIQALHENGTWELQDLPKNRKAINCKWVFRTKRDPTGAIDRYKARLVIKGHLQRKGLDYDETYSPVVRHSSLRYLFAFAVQNDMKVEQMDAVSAYLQGNLSEEIYMGQPPYYVDKHNPNKYCRLRKAIYGLKQGGRVWNNELDIVLRKIGLRKSNYDACVYYKNVDDGIIIVAVYVDDLLLFFNNEQLANTLKNQLHQKFKMKDLGKVSFCLGMRVEQSSSSITLDQEHYIDTVLAKFQMSDCKPAHTPMNSSEVLSKDDCPVTSEEVNDMKRIPYQEAVGCLMYLTQCTRPDISYAVNKLSRYNINPGQKHWSAVKHVLRYLKATKSYRLTFCKSAESKLVGYVDADWAADTDDRKSTTGYVFIAQGGAVSWNSKKQPTVSLSSCEAEYQSLSAITQEALWWNGLINELGIEHQMDIFCDNQSTIQLAKNEGYNPRTKHIDVRHKFIQQAVANGDINVNHISTSEQIADILTKPLDKFKLIKFRDAMGIRNGAQCSD